MHFSRCAQSLFTQTVYLQETKAGSIMIVQTKSEQKPESFWTHTFDPCLQIREPTSMSYLVILKTVKKSPESAHPLHFNQFSKTFHGNWFSNHADKQTAIKTSMVEIITVAQQRELPHGNKMVQIVKPFLISRHWVYPFLSCSKHKLCCVVTTPSAAVE